ncbi:hypothetical protein DDI_2261 [Dickeya dianthicola RNS04.9]|nr:hypothetical protein DDI_2261 [Dickeya dianthicola RNS04.9]
MWENRRRGLLVWRAARHVTDAGAAAWAALCQPVKATDARSDIA